MIDLDSSNFKDIKKLNLAKTKSLTKIQGSFHLSKKIEPVTIIWSGNGYHLYIPAESNAILEQMSEFSKYKEPSKLFLRFTEWYLSHGKTDSEHYHTVSFKNCLLRVPGSYNSKNMSQVTIEQKWNGTSKIRIHLLYDKFLAYLIDQGSKVVRHHNNDDEDNNSCILLSENKSIYMTRRNSRLHIKNLSIEWIERLLKRPLPDHRKYCIWRILAPYFINLRNLTYDESYQKIYQWLDRCNELKELDFPSAKINDSLNRAIKTGYLPISFDNPLKEPRTLKTDNRDLYYIIKD